MVVTRRFKEEVGQVDRHVSFRLLGHESPDGFLLASDAESLSRALQKLCTRLTRAAANRQGVGRSDATVEALSRVRLGLGSGSTILRMSLGDPAALEVDPLAPKVDEDFWAIVEGTRDGRRPESLSDSVAEAAGELVSALTRAAPRVEVSKADRPSVLLVADALDRDTWRVADVVADEAVTYAGRLEAVDLRSGSFRIVDDAENRIPLKSVHDIEGGVGRLVDKRVLATGTRVTGRQGVFSHLTDVILTPHELPQAWTHQRAEPDDIPSNPQRQHMFKDLDVSDEELDAYFVAIHG